MAVSFVLPAYLREFSGGRGRVELALDPPDVRAALAALAAAHPGIRDRVLTETGEVRPHVNVFVANESIRHTGGLSTPVPAGAQIAIVPAVSGGSSAEPGGVSISPDRRPQGSPPLSFEKESAKNCRTPDRAGASQARQLGVSAFM